MAWGKVAAATAAATAWGREGAPGAGELVAAVGAGAAREAMAEAAAAMAVPEVSMAAVVGMGVLMTATTARLLEMEKREEKAEAGEAAVEEADSGGGECHSAPFAVMLPPRMGQPPSQMYRVQTRVRELPRRRRRYSRSRGSL